MKDQNNNDFDQIVGGAKGTTFGFKDDSGDKEFFTIIPNYIADHSSAINQALYLQMKKYAGSGKNGICFASEKLLCNKLGVGRKSLKKALNCLLKYKWIKLVGSKPVQTKGGIQEVKVYSIVNIWGLNSQYYKGVSERTPPVQRGVQKEPKGVSERTPNKIEENKKKKESSFKKAEDYEKGARWGEKPYYDNQEMRLVKGKWFVLPKDGSHPWLKFDASVKEIEWK